MQNQLMLLMKSEEVSVLGKPAETLEERKVLANALAAPDYKLNDYINMQIQLVNYFCEPVTFAPDENGEVKEGIRTVLIGVDGKSYSCAARGVVTALKNITEIFGSADEWEGPLTVEVKQVSLGKNQLLTLRVV